MYEYLKDIKVGKSFSKEMANKRLAIMSRSARDRIKTDKSLFPFISPEIVP